MIRSMTAFGRAKLATEREDITLEMRSVNSRFFDCTVKLPRRYAFLEDRVRSYVQQHAVSRAKVEVFVGVTSHGAGVGRLHVDPIYIDAYLHALRELRDTYGLADDISVMAVAQNPAVLVAEEQDTDPEQIWQTLRSLLDEAIVGYTAMRTAEGEKAMRDMSEKLERVRALSDEVAAISREDTVGYRDRLEGRLRTLLAEHEVSVDENRLLTECAIWADKIAIDEELVRLRSHFGAFYDIASSPEPSGRKLDFLMQELNRETNTIGSKANNARIARLVVEMKGELEKIREQVQNVE